MIFTVKREIDGKLFLRNEDRIRANGWVDAEIELLKGIVSERFDPTCSINGILIEEQPVTDEYTLNLIIAKMNKNSTIDEKIKQGCLFPIYSILFAFLLMILSIVMLRCEGAKSQEETDSIELDEMVQYHRSQGRNAVIDNGYIVINE